MLQDSYAFSGFSVDNLDKAKQFYSKTLGLDVSQDAMGLSLKIKGGNPVFVYSKPNHEPASFTILNFPVKDIDQTVDQLIAKGITFEQYPNMPGRQDAKGIMRSDDPKDGPTIAWFKDPAGNILSIIKANK